MSITTKGFVYTLVYAFNCHQNQLYWPSILTKILTWVDKSERKGRVLTVRTLDVSNFHGLLSLVFPASSFHIDNKDH